MAGNMYRTTPEEMRRAATNVLQTNEQMQSRLSSLRGEVEAVASAWRGPAATAFQQLMTRWQADATTLSRALQGIGEQIQGSGQTYQRTEEEQHQTVSRISQALA